MRCRSLRPIVCAYVSYFAADQLECSGIFATIACGIALRSFERRWISLTVAEDVNRFWDVTALIANALVFFLVGAALDVAIVTRNPAFVIATLAGVLVARFAVAGLLLPAGYPREWLDVVRVAGMRGALSLALAIALPPQVPQRETIIAATFAVALATIISATFTVPAVVARTAARGSNGSSERTIRSEAGRARSLAIRYQRCSTPSFWRRSLLPHHPPASAPVQHRQLVRRPRRPIHFTAHSRSTRSTRIT